MAQGRLHHQWFLYPFPVTSRRSHQNHIGDSLAQPLMSKYGWTTLQPTPLPFALRSHPKYAVQFSFRDGVYCPWPVRFFCLIKIKSLLCWTLVSACVLFWGDPQQLKKKIKKTKEKHTVITEENYSRANESARTERPATALTLCRSKRSLRSASPIYQRCKFCRGVSSRHGPTLKGLAWNPFRSEGTELDPGLLAVSQICHPRSQEPVTHSPFSAFDAYCVLSKEPEIRRSDSNRRRVDTTLPAAAPASRW